MKSILLKIDEKLLSEIEMEVKELKTSRNSYIKKALETYNRILKRKRIEDQLRKEALILRNFDPDLELKKDFETASLTDMQKYLDE
ncbi:MAG TPA: hypothetical protein DIT07_00475 [Sphingobacteriaceae bacterium]|nr:hypothetical protein [Sphingobacteriaceae bacterium]